MLGQGYKTKLGLAAALVAEGVWYLGVLYVIYKLMKQITNGWKLSRIVAPFPPKGTCWEDVSSTTSVLSAD